LRAALSRDGGVAIQKGEDCPAHFNSLDCHEAARLAMTGFRASGVFVFLQKRTASFL
jgi:hypothetical protein